MAAIENVMKRLGFVRLSRYGLILTPEGRIMSLRPDVLDDGQGGKIVGWRSHDLAAAELARYEAPAVTRAVAIPVAITPPTAIRVSPPVAASTISPLTPPRPRPPLPATRPVAPPVAVNVAPPAEPEEDEWEWEIALARARAVSEEVAAAMMPPVRPTRRTRLDTVPPPPVFTEAAAAPVAPRPPSKPKFVEAKTLPLATVATPRDPVIASGEWPQTEPLGNIDYDDRTNPMSEVVRVVRLHQAANPVAKIPAKPTPAPRTFVRAPSPTTVIPIPKLPRSDGHSFAPVVRTRFPQATPAPVKERALGISPPPPIRPADDDKTSPGMMAIPPAAHAVALPRIPSIVKRAR